MHLLVGWLRADAAKYWKDSRSPLRESKQLRERLAFWVRAVFSAVCMRYSEGEDYMFPLDVAMFAASGQR
jgi:hypothetical protein